MKNITLNFADNTIVITKAFAKASANPHSNEYKELKAIRNDNPDYTVVVRTVEKKVAQNNRITIKTMENYIAKHDASGEIMAKFNSLRNEEKGENLHKTTFFQIKKWFFETYPNLKTVA